MKLKEKDKIILSKLKNIHRLTKEIENQRINNPNLNEADAITEENFIKIKKILVCLDNYKDFEEIKPKSDIECLYSQINNCSMKERIVLETMLALSKSNNHKNKSKFLNYNDILDFEHSDKINEDVDKRIFQAVDRVAHKTLHKDKNEKNNNIICQIYNDLNDFEFRASEKSIGYQNVDKLINSLKEKQPYIEFIAIKAIIISIMNLTQELINIYYKNSEEMNLNVNLNIIDDDISDDDEIDMIKINPKIFEILFNDYIFISNRCSFLENFFIESFNNFRTKYQIDFELNDLFTDIFWDKIFHNKIICRKFINLYIGNDKCDENIRKILSKIIKLISEKSIPIKSKIIKTLSLNNLEDPDIDLISSIITQKNINCDVLKNEKIINNVNYKAINPEEIIINGTNNDKNEIILEEKKEEKKEDEKKKPIYTNNEMDYKSVDEIYNYINDGTEVKTKKKKRNKKKKNKKNEKINSNEEKKEDEENDDIVNKFKEDIIKDVIDANRINKIKPAFSENFLNIISQKY